jgi:hypothetical protein
MDALLFMLIASAGAGLLIYTTSLFGTNTNREITAIYNYEYMSNAFIALHYAKDSDGLWFWNELPNRIEAGDAQGYIEGNNENIWRLVQDSSPAKYTVFCWETPNSDEECYSNYDKAYADIKKESGTSLSSSIKMNARVTAYLRLYY